MLLLQKRIKFIADKDDKTNLYVENKVYLRRLASELNNISVSLQLEGDVELPMTLYSVALITALEGSRMSLPFLPQALDEHALKADRLALIKSAREKLATTDGRLLNEEGRRHHSKEKEKEVKKMETFFLAKPLVVESDDQSDESTNTLAVILHNIGVIHHEQGHVELAKQLFLAALDLGEEYPHGSWVFPLLFNNLGHIYQSEGQYDDAMNAFDDACRMGFETVDLNYIRRQHDTSDKPESSVSTSYLPFILYNMGQIHFSQQDYQFALEYFRDSLLDTSDPELFFNIVLKMTRIGRSYHKKGRYVEAIALYNDLLAARKTLLNIECAATMQVFSHLLRDLAYLHYKCGEHDNALVDLAHSLQMMEAAVGQDSPLTTQLRLHNEHFIRKMREENDGSGAAPAA